MSLRFAAVPVLIMALPACSDKNQRTAKRSEPPKRATRDLIQPRWPTGIRLVERIQAPRQQLAAFNRRLGGKLTALTSYVLTDGTSRMRVNIARAVSATEARRLLSRLRGDPSNQGRYAGRDHWVVEFRSMSAALVHRFEESLDLLDRRPRRYRLQVRFALIDLGDAADVNRLSALLVAPRPSDRVWREQVGLYLRRLVFGKTLTLRRAPTAAGRPVYRFKPSPTRTEARGVSTVYTFDKVPHLHTIPYVDVTAEVVTRGYTPIPVARPPGTILTAATPRWPSVHPRFKKLLPNLDELKMPAATRLKFVHNWVKQNIPHGGPQVGARRPTLQTLDVGHGRCWEVNDVFVSLARAAMLPTLQVAGWVAGEGAHIWSEVYVPGRGWLSVDPTKEWLGLSGGHIPLMITGDGHMPVFILRRPTVERLE